MKHRQEEFEAKIHKTDSCWIWNGAIGTGGYGRFGKYFKAHRFSYQLYKGTIPKGLHVLHRCDVRLCVNPEHLWLGTNQDNIDDRNRKGRQTKGTKHPFSKLDELQLVCIRNLLTMKVNQQHIAKYFKVDPSQISRINTGHQYKAELENSLK